MIDKALEFLKGEVETHLELVNETVAPADDFIVLSNVAKENGEWAIPNNKIGMSLINIEEEKVFKDQEFLHRNEAGEIEQYNPNIKLNLYVLFCARYVDGDGDNNYNEGLKQLSNIIGFFQGKYVFTADNSPLMDPSLQKLIVELYSYSFEQQYNFWSILGAKYLPSVLYRVRLVTYQEKVLQNQNQPLSIVDIQGNSL
ncbi:MAG: DUF4255 domain-containing protein [Flavobacteriales bacterium]|nr:DUF4255 domain-containing protein [Flavobacteriales bacterium]